MLFHGLELACQNDCTIQVSCVQSIRWARVMQPVRGTHRTLVEGFGRTLEEALAVLNENYCFTTRGIPQIQPKACPPAGSAEASGPLDLWVMQGNQIEWRSLGRGIFCGLSPCRQGELLITSFRSTFVEATNLAAHRQSTRRPVELAPSP